MIQNRFEVLTQEACSRVGWFVATEVPARGDDSPESPSVFNFGLLSSFFALHHRAVDRSSLSACSITTLSSDPIE